jgi:hypothetical protein
MRASAHLSYHNNADKHSHQHANRFALYLLLVCTADVALRTHTHNHPLTATVTFPRKGGQCNYCFTPVMLLDGACFDLDVGSAASERGSTVNTGQALGHARLTAL